MVSKKQEIVKRENNQKPKASEDLVKKEFTIGEKARIAKYLERLKEGGPVKVKIRKFDKKAGNVNVAAVWEDGKSRQLDDTKKFETFGTSDEELQKFLFNQAVKIFNGAVPSKDEDPDCSKMAEIANNAMAILAGIRPRNEIEGMLAVQMIAVHNMAMETMKLAMLTNQTSYGKETNVNYATKMLRTFIAQMEALQKHRTGGQQKVTVEHVNVTAGGQAIVGVVNQGGK